MDFMRILEVVLGVFFSGGDFGSLLEGLADMYRGWMAMIGFLTLAFGALNCFLGYKLFKFWMAVYGFLGGAFIGTILGIATSGSNTSLGGVIVFALLGGALGAFLNFKLYKLGLFCMLFLMTFGVGMLCVRNVPMSLLLGIGAGIVGIILVRPVIIIATAISGGVSCGLGFTLMVAPGNMPLIYIFGLLFILAGAFVQFKQYPKVAAAQGVPVPAGAAPQDPPADYTHYSERIAAPQQNAPAAYAQSSASAYARPAPSAVPQRPAGRVLPQDTLYLPSWPMAVEEPSLSVGEAVVFSYALRNQSEQAVRSAYLTAVAFDDTGDPVGEPLPLAAMDIELPSYARAAVQTVAMPMTVRKVCVTLDKIAFCSGEVWKNDGTPPLSISPAERLEDADSALVRAAGLPQATFFPAQYSGCWRCTCGALCADADCKVCAAGRETVFRVVNHDSLTALRAGDEAEKLALEAQRLAQAEKDRQLANQRREEDLQAERLRIALNEERALVRRQKLLAIPANAWAAVRPLLQQLWKQDGVICSACGEQNAPDATFCGGCGKALVPQSVCGNCGRVVQGHEKFCAGCGDTLGDVTIKGWYTVKIGGVAIPRAALAAGAVLLLVILPVLLSNL